MANLQNSRGRRISRSIFFLATVCLLAACGEKPIATTENEFEANRMFDVLYSKGLDVKKIAKTGEKAGWDIVVDEGWFGSEEASVATQILNDYGLPRTKEALPEVTSPYGMTSEPEIKKRQNREKEIQIEKQLYDLPGVIKVGVLIAQPATDTLSVLSGSKTPPTASVLIVQTEMPPKFADADVKSQVSGTVPDLKAENIQVTTTYQPLREVPLERLAAQRRRNTVYALGTSLIVVLLAALGAIWYSLKRREKSVESDVEQLNAGEDSAEIAGANRAALESGDDEF